MDYKVHIEELGEIKFLSIPHIVLMDDSKEAAEESKKLWETCFQDSSIEMLKKTCGAEVVYALFCNTFNYDTKMVSYDIACINHLKAAAGEFHKITLRPSKYAVLSGEYKAPVIMGEAYARFNEIFWGEWLPKTDYRCVIDYDLNAGSASIELYTPPDVEAEEFKIKIWYPIEEK